MSIKERWKKLKYWQKTGLMGMLLGILFWYDHVYYTINRRPDEIGFSVALLKSGLYSPRYINILPEGILSILIPDFIFEDFNFYKVSLTAIYFIIGAAFGQLFYELKNPAPLFDKSRMKARMLALGVLLIYLLASAFEFLLWFFY